MVYGVHTSLVVTCDYDATDACANEFDGRMALPVICGKELTAANVTTILGTGKHLVGSVMS